VVRIMRHGTGSGTLGSVWLSRRHMGRDIHVGLRLIHAAERGRTGIVALLGDVIVGIQALSAQIGGRRAPGFLNRRHTR